ncbi:Slp family lipoprotein [Salmonella enterica subsp. enterica]|nr:Slp family lipoprotein [Salmonella enterica subsp. enterica]
MVGCVTIPDAIKGSSPTPPSRIWRAGDECATTLYRAARFGGKVVAVQNQQGKTRLEIATVPFRQRRARPVLGEASRGRIFCRCERLDPVDFRKAKLVTVTR